MRQDDPEFWLEFKRIEEAAKTARWRWLSGCATVGLIAVVIGVVKIVDKPPWVWLCSVIALSLIGPSGIIRAVLKARQKYINKNHRRRVALEKRLDPNRESSSIDSTSEAEEKMQ